MPGREKLPLVVALGVPPALAVELPLEVGQAVEDGVTLAPVPLLQRDPTAVRVPELSALGVTVALLSAEALPPCALLLAVPLLLPCQAVGEVLAVGLGAALPEPAPPLLALLVPVALGVLLLVGRASVGLGEGETVAEAVGAAPLPVALAQAV
jgi:hypothetical protein